MNIPPLNHSRNAETNIREIKNFNNYNIKILMHYFNGSNEFAKNFS